MDTYYTQKEYNDMKRTFEKKVRLLERQNQSLKDKIEKLKKQNVAD